MSKYLLVYQGQIDGPMPELSKGAERRDDASLE